MYQQEPERSLVRVMGRSPAAVAVLRGSAEHADVYGTVKFYPVPAGVLVVAQVTGLPEAEGACGGSFFGFHIHGGGACTGTEADPFANAGMHYNPDGCPHPRHRGDMPPLLGAKGMAFCAFLTDRFTVEEIVGKTVILHDSPDDFTTQPAGNAGRKMACGEIRRGGRLGRFS